MAAPRPALTRPRRGRLVAGVCAGIARRYGWPKWLVRVLFVASCLLPGPQILLYIALWIVIPEDPRD
jgi:phage shock protein C